MKDLTLDITCPGCGKKHRRSFRSLGRGTRVRCSCGSVIKVQDDGFRQAQRQMDGLDRELKRLNRQLRIRL